MIKRSKVSVCVRERKEEGTGIISITLSLQKARDYTILLLCLCFHIVGDRCTSSLWRMDNEWGRMNEGKGRGES